MHLSRKLFYSQSLLEFLELLPDRNPLHKKRLICKVKVNFINYSQAKKPEVRVNVSQRFLVKRLVFFFNVASVIGMMNIFVF